MVRRIQRHVRSIAPGADDALSFRDFVKIAGKPQSTVLKWIRISGLRFKKIDGQYFLSRHDAELVASGQFGRPKWGIFHERMP